MQANYTPPEVEVVTEISEQNPKPQRQYLIDRDELLRLKEEKLIQDKYSFIWR